VGVPTREEAVLVRRTRAHGAWYLRPVEDITDEDSEVYDTAYAIKTPEGEFEYLRNDQGHLVTFDNRANAEAVAGQVANDEVVEVND